MPGGGTDGDGARGDDGDAPGGNDRGGAASSGRRGDPDEVSTAETLVMVLSVAFTLALFGVAVWYALTGPAAPAPTVHVVGSQPAPDGGVAYAVELRNPGDVGLVSATVEAGCTDPPPEIVFENVPADGRRTGTVVCPAGTSDPAVTVSTWVAE